MVVEERLSGDGLGSPKSEAKGSLGFYIFETLHFRDPSSTFSGEETCSHLGWAETHHQSRTAEAAVGATHYYSQVGIFSGWYVVAKTGFRPARELALADT